MHTPKKGAKRKETHDNVKIRTPSGLRLRNNLFNNISEVKFLHTHCENKRVFIQNWVLSQKVLEAYYKHEIIQDRVA